MVNLLKETKYILKMNNKTLEPYIDKILNRSEWIGCDKFYINKDDFIKLANTEYNNEYGSEQVATDLLIVGDNWWLERSEYDGADMWEFKSMPIKPNKEEKIKAITINQAKKITKNDIIINTLKEMNNIK